MSPQPTRVRALKVSIILTALFNLLGLAVLLRGTPRVFTMFMFVGETLFAIAVILLIAAILADLRAKELL
jgi:hypothetical protein